MNLPGLLVEYFINGCVAFIWLYKIGDGKLFEYFSGTDKLILIPIAYVLGMCIDVIAWSLTLKLKKEIRKRARRKIYKDFKDLDIKNNGRHIHRIIRVINCKVITLDSELGYPTVQR
jgi:hypothetical protein